MYLDDPGWRICWTIGDGEPGPNLGPETFPINMWEDKEQVVVTQSAQHSPGRCVDNDGFYWCTKKEAKHATELCEKARKLLKKTVPKKELPAWATAALAAGWNPPMGWTP